MIRVLCLTLLLAGCVTPVGPVMESWQGRKMDDVLVVWGAPNAVQELSDGRKVYTYSRTGAVEGTTYSCRASFVVRAGVVESSHAQGGCASLLRGKMAT